MAEFIKTLMERIEEHPWRCVGILAGFLAGLLMILIGFWETLFILLTAFVGYLLGKGKDDGVPLSERVKKIKERFGLGREE